MPRKPTPPSTYSIGQIAKRWAVSVDRVKRLIESGKLPGAFTIPSSGRYGEAVRVPKEVVQQVEAAWQVMPNLTRKRSTTRKTGNLSKASFRHFPEFGPLPDAESPGDDRY